MHEEWSKGNRRRVAPQVVKKLCGGDSEKDTPVPMPNTAVKPYDAEDTLTGKIGGRQFLYNPQ